MQPRILLFLLLTIFEMSFLKAQSCSPISDNINLGGTAHDPGFQSVDPVDATATLSNGNFVVAWESRDGVDGAGIGAFFQVFNQEGTAVTAVITPYSDVNPDGTGSQGAFGPKVIALQSGFVMAWVSEDGPGDTGPAGMGDEKKDVFFRVYNDMGGAITGSVRLDNNGQEDDLLAMIPLSTGGFAILTAIGEDGSGNTDDLFIQTYNAQGTALTTAPVNISGGAHDGHFQNVLRSQTMAELSDGKFAVTWEARGGVDGAGNGGFFRIFNADGSPVTGVIAPYLDVKPDGAGDQALFGARVIGLTNGNMVMAWGDGDILSEDVYFRVYDANGMAVSATTQTDSDQSEEEGVLSGLVPLSNGNFAILYHTDERSTGNTDDYFVRTFTSSGVAVGGSTEVSGGLHTNFFSATQSDRPSIIALNNGNFAVGWAVRDNADGDGAGAYYRVFNASGAPVSEVTTPYSDVNPDGTGDQSAFGPIMKTLAGGFVIAWQSEGGPGDAGPAGNMEDVYHRVINNDGTPFCPTTKTNSGNDAEEETIEDIVPLANGNFALVYKDEESASGNKDDLLLRVTGGVPVATCPTIGSITIEPNPVCVDGTVTITVSGLENMAQADNGVQDYGIRIQNLLSGGDPYESPDFAIIGTISFDQLGNGGTTAVLSDFKPDGANNLFRAFLTPTPTDVACRPFVSVDLSFNQPPSVSYTAPADIFEDAGVQTGLGGGTPVGGVYSGPGVTDDGNGMTYSFDPAAAGVGVHTITYTFTNEGGCEGSASDMIEVLEKVLEVVPISDINGVDDTTGVALSAGQEVALQGVVHCIDFLSGDGFTFWILEPNGDGILVYSDTTVSKYEATEGDEIKVEGILDQVDGLLEINPTEITVVSQGNSLVSPIAATELNESLENRLVALEITDFVQDDIEVIDFEDGDYYIIFPTAQDTFTVIISGATGIDIDFLNEFLSLNGVTRYTVTGFVGQLDEEEPFNEGYFLIACSELSFDFVSDVNEPAWAGELLVYPNPATYQVTIDAPVQIERLRLIDVQGQVLKNQVIDNTVHTLDLSTLPKGVYQIQLISGDGMVNRQIVRQ